MQLERQAWPAVARSADPGRALLGLARLEEARPGSSGLLSSDSALTRAVVAVMAASPYLTRTCVTDPCALDVLAHLDKPVAPVEPLSRWKALELLRVAALDLSGQVGLEAVGAALSELADQLLGAAVQMAGPGDLAVIGMGKLGARELNYGSDIDIVFVGNGDARSVLELVRQAWRTDVALRPEGRSGPLTRSLASYEAYWDRWAQTWEFQALLKARPAAGDRALGQAFSLAAQARLWGRPLGPDELRSLRSMKSRAEHLVASQGLSEREVKLGRGGIRDIEFAVQLLQLVHGRSDEALRVPGTLDALAALAAGGYVAPADAGSLERAYRWMRSVEHRLQLFEDRQVHAVPPHGPARDHLARVMGYRDGPGTTATSAFDADLASHQAAARTIHERLFFRPLLEAFTSRPRAPGTASAGSGGSRPTGPDEGGDGPAMLAPTAVAERLSAFGFSDATRTRAAVEELTQGFSRTSRLMQTLVPLLLDWLSESPDPDLGLLGLRRLATGWHRRSRVTAVFRESPEAARRLCHLVGTGPLFASGYERHTDQLALLATGPPAPQGKQALVKRALDSTSWRPPHDQWRGLSNFVSAELLRSQARDVLGEADLHETAGELTRLAEGVLEVALEVVNGTPGPVEGLAVIAMGRFGGAELAYASDLDVLVVFDDDKLPASRAEHLAEGLVRLVNGQTPVQRLYELDLSLRPEGRQGSLARSLRAFEAYYARWAQAWERQALTRGRFAAGDPVVGQAFATLADDFVWGKPLGDEDVREVRRLKARMERERVPAGEDPEFHLKLGPGSLSDVEWTVQLLQLQTGTKAEGTLEALEALEAAGAIDGGDATVLAESYRFCEKARNRLFLVRGRPGDSLPPPGHHLTTLARSMGTTAPELRDTYRRLSRRARRVTERLFYGSGGD